MEGNREPPGRAEAFPVGPRVKIAYVDSSCIVAVLLTEAGARRLGRRLGRYGRLYSSNLLEAEVISAAQREGVHADRGALFGNLQWMMPPRALSAEIDQARVVGYLRGADLWHVAHALYLRAELGVTDFLTLDARQAGIAERLAFPVPSLKR